MSRNSAFIFFRDNQIRSNEATGRGANVAHPNGSRANRSEDAPRQAAGQKRSYSRISGSEGPNGEPAKKLVKHKPELKLLSGCLQMAIKKNKQQQSALSLFEIFAFAVSVGDGKIKGQKSIILRASRQLDIYQRAVFYDLGTANVSITPGEFVRCIGVFRTDLLDGEMILHMLNVQPIHERRCQECILRLDSFAQFVTENQL